MIDRETFRARARFALVTLLMGIGWSGLSAGNKPSQVLVPPTALLAVKPTVGPFPELPDLGRPSPSKVESPSQMAPGGGRWKIRNASFEQPLQPWTGWRGAVRASWTRGYDDQTCASLEGLGDERLSQVIPRPLGSNGQDRELACGAWLKLEDPDSVSGRPPVVELRLLGRRAGSDRERLLAVALWQPTARQARRWNYVETESLAPLDGSMSELRIEFRKRVAGRVAVDLVQLGGAHEISGTPQRMVGANYVGRYRSPRFPGTYTSPTSAQERWRNWCWITPPACNNSFTGFYHNPDCGNSESCLRTNGRRDLAISEQSLDGSLPLIGSYDSRDRHVLRYHMELAESAGIDHFIFDHKGHKLAAQLAEMGREPINRESFDAMLDVADEAERRIKIAVMYEPKVHFLGWVTGEPTKGDKVAGIANDLLQLALQLSDRRSALRFEDRLVVFLFRNKICNPAATQCLDENDWIWIHQFVLNLSGEDLFLVGDTAPALGSAIDGLSRWQLVNRDYLLYRSYADVQSGTPTQPAPSMGRLQAHAGGIAESVRQWQLKDPAQRVAIQTVWPGFDDSGVGGWGVNNLNGEDGSPLCVRIADDFEGRFYSTTVDAALASGVDWIQIATFNDWNESTQIEPNWHQDLTAPLLLGGQLSAASRERLFGRMLETRQWITAFKGVEAQGRSFRNIALEYLGRAHLDPAIPSYD